MFVSLSIFCAYSPSVFQCITFKMCIFYIVCKMLHNTQFFLFFIRTHCLCIFVIIPNYQRVFVGWCDAPIVTMINVE